MWLSVGILNGAWFYNYVRCIWLEPEKKRTSWHGLVAINIRSRILRLVRNKWSQLSSNLLYSLGWHVTLPPRKTTARQEKSSVKDKVKVSWKTKSTTMSIYPPGAYQTHKGQDHPIQLQLASLIFYSYLYSVCLYNNSTSTTKGNLIYTLEVPGNCKVVNLQTNSSKPCLTL